MVLVVSLGIPILNHTIFSMILSASLYASLSFPFTIKPALSSASIREQKHTDNVSRASIKDMVLIAVHESLNN